MANIEELNEIQLDALLETINIGCSHAATAVSQMISKDIDISVPEVQIKKIEELGDTINRFFERDEKVIGVYLELTSELLDSILCIFPYKSTLALADILVGQESGTSIELGEMEQSAIMELGNIIVSSYARHLEELLNMRIMPSPPSFSYDMPAAVLKNIGNEATHALMFDTRFNGENNLFKSCFILISSPHSLNALLYKLISCVSNGSDVETDRYLDSLSKNMR